jgi:hypothetical protein
VIDDPVVISAGIAAIATIIVAFVSRAGKKMADSVPPGSPMPESGEHARTRDAVHSMRREMHLRFDAIDGARGTEREQEQVLQSAKRVIEDGGGTA